MAFENEVQKDGEYLFLEKGEGAPIIILHGLFGALSNFQGVIDTFSQKYKVIVPLMPIYEQPIRKAGVNYLSEFITSFIDHRGYKNVTLLGNSLGGHIALIYAKKHLDNVHAMILAGSSGLYENAFGGSFPRRNDKEYLRQKIALTFYDEKMVTDDLVEELYETINDKSKLIRILALAKSAIRHNMEADLPLFKMPTCIIWGCNDNVTPPEVAEMFHEKLPNSSLFWIDKCGHAPMMEHPEEFNEILQGWLVKNV